MADMTNLLAADKHGEVIYDIRYRDNKYNAEKLNT